MKYLCGLWVDERGEGFLLIPRECQSLRSRVHCLHSKQAREGDVMTP